MKHLFSALLSAQRSAKAVAKEATNAFMKYKYATAESMVEEAKLHLNNAGLVLLLVEKTVQPSANGGTELVQKFVLAHPESGEAMDLKTSMAVVIDKGKPADKSEASTATFDLGYFMKSLVLLVREDAETAVDARDDRAAPDQTKLVADLNARIAACKDMDALKALGTEAKNAGVTPGVMEAYKAKFQAFKDAEKAA